MELLLDKNEEYKEYSVEKYTIGTTCSKRKNIFLPYVRDYGELNKEQLLFLINKAKENGWTALDLSNCGLKSLPDELWEISSLKLLYLGNITSDGPQNEIDEISEGISNLVNLQALSISNLNAPSIPLSMRRLPKLTYLDCFGCDYTRIPYNLLNPRVKAIGIECRNVAQFRQLCKIRKIEEIYITGSSVKFIPEEIGGLSSLRKLMISGSDISSIPDSMLNLKKLKCFSFYGTPLAEIIPSEINEQTAFEIIHFICKQQKEKSDYFFNESKMIVVGQGNVGKSCLVERITENKYEDKTGSSLGCVV